jgi:histidine triad (HIT) family protein
MIDCVFCMIAEHNKSAQIVYEDDHIMAFLDNDPISDGHTLIIPKKDIRDIHDLDEITSMHVMSAAKRISNIIKKEFSFDGVTIMANSGHFQDIPHFHLHVFGRNKDKDISIEYPSGINNSPEYLILTADKIRARLK